MSLRERRSPNIPADNVALWLMRGLSSWEVVKMVGHTDLKMIEQRYGHLYLDALQEEIDRLSEEAGRFQRRIHRA